MKSAIGTGPGNPVISESDRLEVQYGGRAEVLMLLFIVLIKR